MSHLSRRIFFQGAALAASATRVMGANDRVNIGIVGIGGRGNAHLGYYSKIEECRIAGLCDVNQAARERAQTRLASLGGAKAKEYADMRELFADKDIDAVSIATPNHWHSLATIWACEAGKDVYCEKPASYNPHESRRMVEVARKTGRMVQIGSQGRSAPHKIKAMRLLQEGAIGKLYMAKGLCFKRRKSIGMDTFNNLTPPTNPWECALSPDGRRLYVVYAGTNDMNVCQVLDDDHAEIERQGNLVRLGQNPRAVRVSPDGRLVYVSNTLDFEVAAVLGGEAGLKALCDRAAAKGIRLISWMAAHYSPNTALQLNKELGHGNCGIFAAKESGRHPDTGYPASCWTANLNAPIAQKMKQQILGICQRTGLAGFLWDSFSNLGWWQVDYSDGTMRPQTDRMVQLYADLLNAGLYLMPEAITAISNHSCCGLHGGNIYRGELRDFMYRSAIGPWYDDGTAQDYDQLVVKGEAPIDLMFRDIANEHLPSFSFHAVPRDKWNPQAVAGLKELFALYKATRHLMQRRTVLKDNAGILWENDGPQWLLFSTKEQKWPGEAVDAATGEPAAGGRLKPNRAYRVAPGSA